MPFKISDCFFDASCLEHPAYASFDLDLNIDNQSKYVMLYRST